MKSTPLYPSVKRNIALNTAYQILNMVIPFITAPYVSRVLGAEGIGIFSYTSSILAYFTMFSSLGTTSYGIREISRVRDNRQLLSKLFWEIELLVICTTSLCSLLWGIWIIVAPEYNIIYLILSMGLIGVVADISWFFTGLEQFEYIVIRNSVVKLVGIISLFVFIHEEDDLQLYIFIMSLINLLGVLSMWIYVPKLVDKMDWKSLSIKKHYKETLVYFIPTISISVYTILNKILLGIIGGDIRENGYYEQANRIIMICQTVTFGSINIVIGSRASYLFAENKFKEMFLRIDQTLNYILLIGLGLVAGLVSLSPRFVPWFFGQGFEPVVLLIQLLSPLLIIIGISNCLGWQYYTPAGLRKQSARFIIVGAIVNLILNLILIPRFGAVGAVVGSLMAELSITILYFSNCKDFMTLRQIFRNGWRKLTAAVVMFFAVLFVSQEIKDNTLSIFVSCLIGTIAYCSILLIMHDDFSWQLINLGLRKFAKSNKNG